MLFGIPPFYHKNQNTMFQSIKDSELKFSSSIQISAEAKDLISIVYFFLKMNHHFLFYLAFN